MAYIYGEFSGDYFVCSDGKQVFVGVISYGFVWGLRRGRGGGCPLDPPLVLAQIWFSSYLKNKHQGCVGLDDRVHAKA